jgi:hypothetical protein
MLYDDRLVDAMSQAMRPDCTVGRQPEPVRREPLPPTSETG